MSEVEANPRGRREIKGALVRPWAQIRYVGLLNLAWLAVSMVILKVSGGYLREAIGSAEVLAQAPPDSKGALLGLVDRWIWIAVLCVVTSALLALFHTLWYSQRIFGPLVPLRRMIDDLKAGRYDARLRYRQKDEMQEVMQMVNELAATLEARHGKSPAVSPPT